MTPSYSIYKTIKNASPSSKEEVNRVFSLLRAGKVGALMRERLDKIGAAKPNLSGTTIEAQRNDEPGPSVGLGVLVALGDLYADQCACGSRAYFGEATQSGPKGCIEAVRSGRVFCEAHVPAHLLAPNPLSPANS